MNFVEAKQRYRTLKHQYDSESLAVEEFDNALRELMVQDEQGRWWALDRESGDWNYYDDARFEWVSAQPPQPPTQPPSPTQPIPALPPPPVPPSPPPPPPVSSGLKVVFYLLSFFVPLVGIVFFFVYRSYPAEEDRKMAQVLLILGLVSIALSCICSFMSMLMFNSGVY